MRKTFGVSLLVTLLASLAVAAQFPSGFTAFPGQMYGEASQGQPAHHSHQTLTVSVPHGMIVDAGAGGGNVTCCGGPENRNADSTAVPSGIAVSLAGGGGGEWGVFNITRETVVDDDTGDIKAYKVHADLYCGPSAQNGGCNVHMTAAIKLRNK